jgi:hypothetical protein
MNNTQDDSAQDVIQFAIDHMGQDVRVLLQGQDGQGSVSFFYGTVSGLGSLGDEATITLDKFRITADPDLAPVTHDHMLIDIDTVLDISPA